MHVNLANKYGSRRSRWIAVERESVLWPEDGASLGVWSSSNVGYAVRLRALGSVVDFGGVNSDLATWVE